MSTPTLVEKNQFIKTVISLSVFAVIMLLASPYEALAAPPETMPIWRIQVFFETFNTSDAGSDDSVRVELNPNNGTWVDSGFDDWEIGSRTYDLRLDGISRISDLDYFRVSKTGSGGWCIGRIRLIVNGATLYDEQFPSGHWLDNSGGHSTVYFIDDYFMRQRAHWINYVVPTRPNIVPVGGMRSRIQCLFGDFLTANDDLGFRNSNPITIFTLDANTWRVNVDLDDTKPGPVPDPDIDVDFDLTVLWTGSFFARPDLRVENLHVGYTWPAWGESARTFMNTHFQPRINEMMKNFSYRVGTGIQLAPNGDLHFLPIVFNPVPIDFAKVTATTGAIANLESQPFVTSLTHPERLELRVRTGGDIEAFAERTITATLSSGLKKDSEVDLILLLPAEILMADAALDACDGEGTRSLTPEIELRSDGATLVRLRDRVAAGKKTDYALRLIFRPDGNETAQIIIRVGLANADADPEAISLQASTSFRFDAGRIRPEGTICVASKANPQ
jgi:hypothetical protein